MQHGKKLFLILFLLLASVLFTCAGSAEEPGTAVLPEDLRIVEEEAFLHASFSQIQLPPGVEEIHARAFAESALTEVFLPESLTYIADDAFDGPDRVTVAAVRHSYAWRWAVRNGYIAYLTYTENPDGTLTITGFANPDDASDPDLWIPDTILGKTVTGIGEAAFWECFSLQSVVLPETVQSIESGAFAHCTSLTQINFPAALTSIDNRAFYNCQSLARAELPDGIASVGYDAFIWDTLLVCGRDSVTAHALEAFDYPFTSPGEEDFRYRWDGDQLRLYRYVGASESLILPEWIDVLEISAFGDCSTLVHVELNDHITTIPETAFWQCTSLQSVVLPETVQCIESGAFAHCTSLNQINFPAALTSIDNRAFYNCHSLARAELPDGIASVGYDAFIWDTLLVCGRDSVTAHALETFDYPFTSPGEEDFRYRWHGNQLHLYRYVGASYFLELPSWIDELENYAFEDRTTLETIRFNGRISRIPEGAFYNCTSLEYLMLPDSVTSIGGYAFGGCRHLAKLLIPASVSSIEDSAFRNLEIATIYVYPDSYALAWCLEHGWGHTVLQPMTATVSLIPEELDWLYQPYYTPTHVQGGIPPYSARYTYFLNGTALSTSEWWENRDNRDSFPGWTFYPQEEGSYTVTVEVKDLRGVTVTATSAPAGSHIPTEEEIAAVREAQKLKLIHDKLVPVLEDVKAPYQSRGVHYYKSLGDSWSGFMWAMSMLQLDFSQINTYENEINFLISNALKAAAAESESTANPINLWGPQLVLDNVNTVTDLAQMSTAALIHVFAGNMGDWLKISDPSLMENIISDYTVGLIDLNTAAGRIANIPGGAGHGNMTALKQRLQTYRKINKFSETLKSINIAGIVCNDVVEAFNEIALLECINFDQLEAVARGYLAGNGVIHDAGEALMEFCNVTEEARVALILYGKGKRLMLDVITASIDFGGNAVLVFKLTVGALDALTGSTSLPRKFQDMNYAVNGADACWAYYQEKRSEYKWNPSPLNARQVLYTLKNYHESIALADSLFYDLVNGAQTLPFHELYLGDPVVRAAARASTNAAQQHAKSDAVDELLNLLDRDPDIVESLIDSKINNYLLIEDPD